MICRFLSKVEMLGGCWRRPLLCETFKVDLTSPDWEQWERGVPRIYFLTHNTTALDLNLCSWLIQTQWRFPPTQEKRDSSSEMIRFIIDLSQSVATDLIEFQLLRLEISLSWTLSTENGKTVWSSALETLMILDAWCRIWRLREDE